MKRIFFTLGLIAILTTNCLANAQMTTDSGRPPEATTSNQQTTETTYVEDCSVARIIYLNQLKFLFGSNYIVPGTNPTQTVEEAITEYLLNCPDCLGTIDDLNFTQCCTSSLIETTPANCCTYNPTLNGCPPTSTTTPSSTTNQAPFDCEKAIADLKAKIAELKANGAPQWLIDYYQDVLTTLELSCKA